jgi:hypothetical protein
MKAFKLTDCCLQITLFANGAIWLLIHDADILLTYCLVAVGNLLSCLIHIALKYDETRTSARSEYQRYMLWILGIAAASWSLGGVFAFFFVGLLIVFPFTTLIYINISLKETVALFKTKDHEK